MHYPVYVPWSRNEFLMFYNLGRLALSSRLTNLTLVESPLWLLALESLYILVATP